MRFSKKVIEAAFTRKLSPLKHLLDKNVWLDISIRCVHYSFPRHKRLLSLIAIFIYWLLSYVQYTVQLFEKNLLWSETRKICNNGCCYLQITLLRSKYYNLKSTLFRITFKEIRGSFSRIQYCLINYNEMETILKKFYFVYLIWDINNVIRK